MINVDPYTKRDAGTSFFIFYEICQKAVPPAADLHLG